MVDGEGNESELKLEDLKVNIPDMLIIKNSVVHLFTDK